MNFSDLNADLDAKYFDSMCQSVFRPGVPLANYVPPAITVSMMEGNSSKLKPNEDEFFMESRQR